MMMFKMKLTSAQIPLVLAVFGLLSFWVRKMMRPASGMKKESMANPTLAFCS